jgi:hypothetical protein
VLRKKALVHGLVQGSVGAAVVCRLSEEETMGKRYAAEALVMLRQLVLREGCVSTS